MFNGKDLDNEERAHLYAIMAATILIFKMVGIDIILPFTTYPVATLSIVAVWFYGIKDGKLNKV